MNVNEVMQELEALGSEQTRKTFRRHGGADPMFGVKFGDLGGLQKRIKTDHALAKALWKTGNHDARLLACVVADASAATEQELNAWAAAVKDTATAEALANLASRTPVAAKVRKTWLAESKLQRAGWSMVSRGFASPQTNDADSLDESAALAYLKRIEINIHKAENWTRRTMMSALIAIGGRSPALRKAAEGAARRIGPVAFDPGDTACEFPDPVPYLAKVWARKK